MILKICKKTIIFDLMKALFVGDASNLHNCLAQELRKMGHEAVVASNGSMWMRTGRDINLFRGPGAWGAVCYLARLLKVLPLMRGYDVVHIAGHIFLTLKPEKVQRVFDYLKKHNGKIVLSALNTDYYYFKACHDGHTFRYSDYMVGDEPSPYVNSPEYEAQCQQNWTKPFMRRHAEHILENVDGAVACLLEYYMTYKPLLGDRVIYAGIPIDTQAIEPHFIAEEPEKVRFFIGIQRDRTVVKGTDRLLDALRRVAARYPDECEVVAVENLPYDDYLSRMRSSHVLVDQLYSYTPATNALLGMAHGLVAVSGAEPEYYELIGEKENRPIVNVSPLIADDIDAQLSWLIEHKSQLPAMSRASRAFVEKHNAAHLVASRYVEFWNSL